MRGLRCFCAFKLSIRLLIKEKWIFSESKGHFDDLCICNEHTVMCGELSTLSNHSLLTAATLKVFDGAAFVLVIDATFDSPSPVWSSCGKVSLRLDVIIRPSSGTWFTIIVPVPVLCRVWDSSLRRLTAYSLINNVVWYANFFSGAVFWLLQFNQILWLIGSSSLSTNISLRTCSL